MPISPEDLALKDLIKHPKLMIIYTAFAAIGWFVDKLIPNDCQKETARWQQAFYHSEKRSDSISYVLYKESLQKDHTINQQAETIRTVDSLLGPLGTKAKQILKEKRHER